MPVAVTSSVFAPTRLPVLTPDATVQRTTLTATGRERAAFVITLKPDPSPPCPDDPRYREQTGG